MSIFTKPYEISKSILSTGLSKSGESLKWTISTAWSQIWQTISATATPSWNYISTIASKAPGTLKADVIDTTFNDLKFTGFTKTPIKSTAKAIFSPVMAIPRAGWSLLKSWWSMTSTAATQAPKLVRDTTTTALWWAGKILWTSIKWITWLISSWVDAINAWVDTASGSWSKSEAKK